MKGFYLIIELSERNVELTAECKELYFNNILNIFNYNIYYYKERSADVLYKICSTYIKYVPLDKIAYRLGYRCDTITC